MTVLGKRVLLPIAAVLLGACAAPQSTPRQVNQSGYSMAFKQGYADGCDSARAVRRRDEQRFRTEADYMIGWNDGYSICRRR